MKVCVVSSGSKGNMTYIEAGNEKLLIDTGITLTNAQGRVSSINFSEVNSILITHEHGDHVQYLDTVLKKTNANVYMSKKTYGGLKPVMRDKLVGKNIGFLESEAKYKIGVFEVLTFKLLHDCGEVLGYIVSHEGKRVGYFTDTGIFPEKYLSFLKTLDVLIIEANHNVEMLLNSNRGYTLINRILSPQGHISNQKCYEILKDNLGENSKYVVLAHVSEDCNNEQALHEDIIDKLYDYKGEIIIANQYKATKIMEV